MIEVVDPGGLTTIQDLGRPGRAHLGVPRSGAADPRSFTLANRLVGNAEDAPALETTVRGPTLRFRRDAIVALAGAPVEAWTEHGDLTMNAPERVRAGEILRVGVAIVGVRTYIAIRGGLACERILGSASTDTLGGLGPPSLEVGTKLQLGNLIRDWPSEGAAPVPALPREPWLRVDLSPRADWFAEEATAALYCTSWSVSDADRVGVRLTGGALPRRHARELRSEGVLPGALQVPPSGSPILLLVDHPTTGGYPVIAVVVVQDMPLAAQLRPGQRVRFVLNRNS